MSHRVGRVVSDLSHRNHRKATDHGLCHQSTSSNSESSSKAAAKQKLSLLFTGVSTWRRSASTDATSSSTAKSCNRKQQTKETGKRRGLEIGQMVRKYVSMVEQLFTASSGGSRERDRPGLRRRPHTFTSSRSGNAPSKRHKGRLSSAPGSLRGSPSSSGHLSVEASVKVSTSSEVSTMEELQSAIQAAIAHCKNSVAVAKQAAAADDDSKCKC